MWLFRENSCVFALFLMGILLLLPRFGVSEQKIYKEQLSSRIVRTQYGQMRAVLVEFRVPGLKPVDAYLGIQYATTFGSQIRFMPPTSSAEKWRGMRSMFGVQPACPQRVLNSTVLTTYLPAGEVERLMRVSPATMSQNEECLYMNVHVPTGK